MKFVKQFHLHKLSLTQLLTLCDDMDVSQLQILGVEWFEINFNEF